MKEAVIARWLRNDLWDSVELSTNSNIGFSLHWYIFSFRRTRYLRRFWWTHFEFPLVPNRLVFSPSKIDRINFPNDAAFTGSIPIDLQWLKIEYVNCCIEIPSFYSTSASSKNTEGSLIQHLSKLVRWCDDPILGSSFLQLFGKSTSICERFIPYVMLIESTSRKGRSIGLFIIRLEPIDLKYPPSPSIHHPSTYSPFSFPFFSPSIVSGRALRE